MGDVIYIGEKGTLMGHRLAPEARMKSYGRPPKKLARSVGHHKEFVDACRGGPPAGANFVDHAGLLTETCMLGNVALRAGTKLQWDGPNFKITNNTAANQFLHRQYRAGWQPVGSRPNVEERAKVATDGHGSNTDERRKLLAGSIGR